MSVTKDITAFRKCGLRRLGERNAEERGSGPFGKTYDGRIIKSHSRRTSGCRSGDSGEIQRASCERCDPFQHDGDLCMVHRRTQVCSYTKLKTWFPISRLKGYRQEATYHAELLRDLYDGSKCNIELRRLKTSAQLRRQRSGDDGSRG